MTTKEKIIFESLKLFSVNGYEAVSTRMIARAVDASDSVIYKHFKNKQEILDSIVEVCLNRFSQGLDNVDVSSMDWNMVEKVCMDFYDFQTMDEWIKPFRRLLTIEQFRNPRMVEIYRKFFIDIPVQSSAKMFEELMELGYMKKGDAAVYAMELYSPFFMCNTLEDNDGELREQLKKHIEVFKNTVMVEK